MSFINKEVTVQILNPENIQEDLKIKSFMVMNLILLLLEALIEFINYFTKMV